MRSLESLNQLITKLTRFNAARSLRNLRRSKFQAHHIGDVIAMVDTARPGSPMVNRVLGFRQEAIGLMADILAVYEAAGEQPHFDITSEHLYPEIVESLIGHDFTASTALNYLSLKPSDAEPATRLPSSTLVTERWNHDRADAFFALLESSGFVGDPDVWKDRKKLYCTDIFRTYVVSCEGQPCAWATMFVDDQQGYLANAYTQAEHRNQGCHSALLAARIQDARDLGLQQIFTDVVANSQSHRNCKTAGLCDLTVVTQWIRET